MASLSRYNNLTQRILTGLAGSALIAAGILFHPFAYFIIFLLICTLSMLEFYKLAGLDGTIPLKWFGTICAAVIFSLSFFVESGMLPTGYYYLIFPLLSIAYMIKLYKKFERKPFTNIAFTFLGIFYIGVPYALLNVIAFDNQTFQFEIVLACLLILWSSDTGAYFAGTFLGKRKLFERISPKKSWEGFFGGALLAFAMTLLLSHYFHVLNVYQWMVIGTIIIVGGTFGDLIESLLKRTLEIKDSGTALPGHGGFLDRFDGLLISVPFIAAYLEIIK